MHNEERSRLINKVSFISICVNIALSIFKLAAGYFAHSQAMISDAVHSLSDVFSTVIVVLGVNIAKKNKDEHHPYGHEKLESIASVILSLILIATAVGIGVNGIKSIRNIIVGEPTATPLMFALIAAAVSIAAKECMYRFTKNVAKKTKSTALMADAWHNRSDALSSIGSLIGVGGAMLGVAILDPIASIVIAVLIIRVAIKVGITGINEVTDHAADVESQKIIFDTIATVKGVWFIDELRTRLHGSRLCVDVDIAVDGKISVEEAHNIADNVSEAVYSCELGITECMVHINPYRELE